MQGKATRIPLANAAPFFNDAKIYVTNLESLNLSPNQQLQAIQGLFFYYHHTQSHFQEKAYACAYQGAASGLLRLGNESTSEDVRSEAFVALGAMCFVNEGVCELVAADPQLPVVLVTKRRNSEVCYLINNVAAYSWLAHTLLIRFVPEAVRIMSDHTISLHHRAWCVRFCGQLAYNEANRDQLIQMGALQQLVHAMNTGDVNMACCTAAVAVGCLVGHSPEHAGLLEASHNIRLIELLVGAFESSLMGRDFPNGSHVFYYDWKLAMGLSSLAVHTCYREGLIDHGLMPLLKQALSKKSADARLVHHGLVTLWRLAAVTPPARSSGDVDTAVANM